MIVGVTLWCTVDGLNNKYWLRRPTEMHQLKVIYPLLLFLLDNHDKELLTKLDVKLVAVMTQFSDLV